MAQRRLAKMGSARVLTLYLIGIYCATISGGGNNFALHSLGMRASIGTFSRASFICICGNVETGTISVVQRVKNSLIYRSANVVFAKLTAAPKDFALDM